jgi:hypothetical protein
LAGHIKIIIFLDIKDLTPSFYGQFMRPNVVKVTCFSTGIDDELHGFRESNRVLFSSVHYPAHYGFILQTYCDDHNPLDVLVICSIDVYPMCIIDAKVIGAM